MNSSKLIDISKSSIVGLKAELLKKQEEVKRLKELQQSQIKPEIIQKKKLLQEKSNDGVEKRRAKDIDVIEEDYDALNKSREVLEAKARLYDRLKGNSTDEQTKSKYLIDFDLKRKIDKEDALVTTQEESKPSDNEEDYSDSNSDPENDWVDFVDALGRSRSCLRKDLPEMRAKDAKLAATISPPSPPPDTASTPPTPTPELLSWDMQREMMRQKWEQQEALLLGKKDVHYQDVRFDEARPHGVGYFEFSTDEAERARQQEELQKMRAQTQQQQEAALGLRMRRQQQTQARLAAARRRRRERLGLPPESPPHEVETPTIDEEQNKFAEEESIVDLEESVKKVAPIRPWDIGKNGLAPVMSQEEWVEKKRQERPEEFAPPSSLIETKNLEDSTDQKWKSNPNVFTSKKTTQQSLTSGKLKKKHKKSKSKKEKEYKLQEKKEEDQEESFGPSVKEWQDISKFSCSVITNNSSDIKNNPSTQSTQEPVKGTLVDSDLTAKCWKDLPSGSDQVWKPTVTDIDLLLSLSRAASCVSTPPEEEVKRETKKLVIAPSKDPHMGSGPSYIINNKAKNTSDNISEHTNHEGPYQRNDSFKKYENSETVIKPITNLLEVDSDGEDPESYSKNSEPRGDNWKSNKRKFAEIPPPPAMSYYVDADKNIRNPAVKPQLADSISAGISYLHSQTVKKSKKRLKGMLDII